MHFAFTFFDIWALLQFHHHVKVAVYFSLYGWIYAPTRRL